MATPATRPSELLDRALAGSTNDEAIELAYALLENLSFRAERAADIAIDSGDRDAENDAIVFTGDVFQLVPNSFSSNPRLDEMWHTVHAARSDIKTAVRNRRASTGRGPSRVEEFSHRRQARVRTAHQVQWLREEEAAEATVARARVTPERVAKAATKLDGEFQVLDIALLLLPALSDKTVEGRQLVIARVSQEVTKLVRAGALVKHRPEDSKEGRVTCRYTRAGGDDG